MSSQGLKRFRDAGLTKVQPNGNEQFFINNAVPDAEGRRVYCCVAEDMTLNDLVALTPNQKMMCDLKFGAKLLWEDWTEAFNIQPSHLEETEMDHMYGARLHKGLTFERLMEMDESCFSRNKIQGS